jgi:hypothetical protein
MIGRPLGSYTVLAKLGAGEMGEVDRVRDTRLNRDVAIKSSRWNWSKAGRSPRSFHAAA